MEKRKNKETLLWVLTGRGFGSEINNLLYAINYSHKKGINLRINSNFWNFKYQNGLSDYFIFEEEKHFRENLLLFLFKPFFNPLTHFYQNTNLYRFLVDLFSVENKPYKKESLLSITYNTIKTLMGLNISLMFGNFYNVRTFNQEERVRDWEKYIQQMNTILKKFWVFKPEILKEIEILNSKINRSIGGGNYAAFHIRRGDKVAETTFEDRVYYAKEYMYKLIAPDLKIDTVFLMTDDYNAINEFNENYPTIKFISLADMNDQGHSQDEFNKLDRKEIRRNAVKLFAEIEIARNSKIFIGSRGSNIFRLIEYLRIYNCHDLSNDKESI
jgi:hypothetical protein